MMPIAFEDSVSLALRPIPRAGDYWVWTSSLGRRIYHHLIERRDGAWISRQIHEETDYGVQTRCTVPTSTNGDWDFVGRTRELVLFHDMIHGDMLPEDELDPRDLSITIQRYQSPEDASFVRILHNPTGLSAASDKYKSQLRNKSAALLELRDKVRRHAAQRCAKCSAYRPEVDYLCERCRSLV